MDMRQGIIQIIEGFDMLNNKYWKIHKSGILFCFLFKNVFGEFNLYLFFKNCLGVEYVI
jgi:hypothetical protein